MQPAASTHASAGPLSLLHLAPTTCRWCGALIHPLCRYLGLFDTEEEAAVAYDRAAVEIKGAAAILNFPLANYTDLLSEGGCACLHAGS